MFKLDLEKSEEPEIKLILEKAREFQEKIYFFLIGCTKASVYMDHKILENSWRDGSTRSL